jgi:hypothetical protein
MPQAVYEALASLPGAHEGRVFRTRSIRTAFERAVAMTLRYPTCRQPICRTHSGSSSRRARMAQRIRMR